MPWVYILRTKSNKYYIGSTTDIQSRLVHHEKGFTPSTKSLGFEECVFKQEYKTLSEARIIERKIKNLKRRDYVEKIIKDGYIRIRP